MKEAQRFPADFDGIIAGAPGLDWTAAPRRRCASRKALETNEAARLLAAAARSCFTAPCVEACDALDGVKDGLIENPTALHVRSGVLECKGGDGATCLTKPQVETAR